MLAYGDTYRPTLQNKSSTQGTVTLHCSLFMAWLILERVTTVVPSVNKDVLETEFFSLTFRLTLNLTDA